MLKLMPILEYMRACEEAKSWVREKNFATFDEAWAACPNAWWIDYVIAVMADDGNAQADALWTEMRPRNDAWWSHTHATKCADIERWLVEYAHKHGCAVEVAS